MNTCLIYLPNVTNFMSYIDETSFQIIFMYHIFHHIVLVTIKAIVCYDSRLAYAQCLVDQILYFARHIYISTIFTTLLELVTYAFLMKVILSVNDAVSQSTENYEVVIQII